MDKSYKIIDNALDKQSFLEIKNLIESGEFEWFFNKDLTHFDNKDSLSSYFVNIIYKDDNGPYFVRRNIFRLMFPILNLIAPKQLIRIKANLYPRTQTIEHHLPHTDYDFPHKGAMFYINSNDGKTVINNGEVEIESIENRLVLFNSAIHHNSTSTTNQKARINLNINYI